MRTIDAIRTRAFIAEGVFAETIKSHTTQEACGNNAVGVDVIAWNSESETFNLGDFCERHTILRK
jgi:hypothetical protein